MTAKSVRATRKLTLVPLAAATYFMVSGGPTGIEELVQDCGYSLALAILCFLPLIWSVPTGLMVGELASAIPSEGGFYVWVRRAMGPFWGFQEAWLSLMASIFDMAAYPTVFVLSLAQIWPPAQQGYNGVLLAAAVIAGCLLWNLFGAKAVGDGSLLLGALLLTPFAAIIAFALIGRRSLAGVAIPKSREHADLLGGVIVAMWNYMGWDNASTVAEEVENPRKIYPRVMMAALVAIILSYTLPVFAVSKTHLNPAYWTTGAWAGIAELVAGPWLGIAVVIAAMISTFGIVNSLTMSYSRLPLAMAEDGYAPRFLTRKLSNGAPWAAILLCGAAWIAALGFSLDRLLMLDILLYGASLILEFVALVLLRIREPGLPRPFRVPGGVAGAIVAGIGPTALLIIAFLKNRNEKIGSISALDIAMVLMAAGVPFYYFVRGRGGRR